MDASRITERTYLRTWIALMALAAATFGLSFLDLGVLHVPVALLIAGVKAVLIALFFMHLKGEVRTIFWALVLEAALVSVLGSVLGAGLAWLAGAATNSYYRRYFDTELIFSLITPRIVLFSVCLSLLLGLAAGALAAWRLVRTPPMVLWGRA